MTERVDEQPKVSVLIADDHGILRAAVRMLLNTQSRYETVGEASEAGETLRLAETLCPDLVLLDITMPGRDGLEVTRQLKQTHPKMRVLILTAHEDVAMLREAISAGASGYVVKRAMDSELLGAIDAAMRGDLYVHPSVTRALISEGQSAARVSSDPGLEMLTPREAEVLRLLADGFTNQQAADRLVLSVRTVETHRANLMGKLGLRNRAELVRFAMDHGLIKRT